MTRNVRDATPDDAAACAAIYAPYVRDTAITFETEPPDAAEFARRIAAATARYAWLVLEDDGHRRHVPRGGVEAGPLARRGVDPATSADVGEPTSAIPTGSGTMR